MKIWMFCSGKEQADEREGGRNPAQTLWSPGHGQDLQQFMRGLRSLLQRDVRHGIDLHVEEGVILPHLMMKKDTGGCYFLGEDGRCTIHAYRPGICRLFPLGRQYDEEKTSYFIVPEGCVKGGLSKVRIDKWLGIPDLPAYEDFKSRWHSFIRTLTARIAAEQSDEIRRNINLYFLRLFFVQPYNQNPSASTFYEDVSDRMKRFADAVL